MSHSHCRETFVFKTTTSTAVLELGRGAPALHGIAGCSEFTVATDRPLSLHSRLSSYVYVCVMKALVSRDHTQHHCKGRTRGYMEGFVKSNQKISITASYRMSCIAIAHGWIQATSGHAL